MAPIETRRRRAGIAALLCAIVAAVTAGLIAAPGPGPAHAQTSAARGIVCSDFGGGPPYRFQAYEATRDRAPYLSAQRLAAVDALLPSEPDFALPEMEAGPADRRSVEPDSLIPDVLLHAIGWVESTLNQTAIQVPYESVGPVLISPDCAYGVMQVASAFSNRGDTPSRTEALTGTHYAYNIAAGARILIEKWNGDVIPVVGMGEREFIEAWYYALWAYNGWATSNHPAGPEVDPFRSLPYDCDGPYNGYTYQELVIGCLINPPAPDGRPLWPAVPVEHPDLAALAQPGGPLDPEHFFTGWRRLLAGPFAAPDHGRPFDAMNAPLPAGAQPYRPAPLGEAEAEAARRAIFGDPRPEVEGGPLELGPDGEVVRPLEFTIRNAGSGLLVYRVVPEDAWLRVSLDAGVAVGSPPGRSRDDVTVQVEIEAGGLPAGVYEGSILVEALLPGGGVETTRVAVGLEKQGVPQYEAGRPRS
ncbi:MAG: hypothetical protein OXI03_07735 [Chloroflexota bacterium]|nr:hypothetical protein [Chloroflexota bacterium]